MFLAISFSSPWQFLSHSSLYSRYSPLQSNFTQESFVRLSAWASSEFLSYPLHASVIRGDNQGFQGLADKFREKTFCPNIFGCFEVFKYFIQHHNCFSVKLFGVSYTVLPEIEICFLQFYHSYCKPFSMASIYFSPNSVCFNLIPVVHKLISTNQRPKITQANSGQKQLSLLIITCALSLF